MLRRGCNRGQQNRICSCWRYPLGGRTHPAEWCDLLSSREDVFRYQHPRQHNCTHVVKLTSAAPVTKSHCRALSDLEDCQEKMHLGNLVRMLSWTDHGRGTRHNTRSFQETARPHCSLTWRLGCLFLHLAFGHAVF